MYNIFDKLILRTPFLSYNDFKKENVETLFQNQQIREAIYIASPILYAEWQRLLNGEIKDPKEKERIHSSLNRYVSRMATRCTPFGLFAGCTVGNLGDVTSIILKDNIQKHTRLDMFYLCALSQMLSKLPDIQKQMNYYPNSSLYTTGKKYRYVEYQYLNAKRVHQISAIERSVYLDAILNKAEKGIKTDTLITYLIQNEIPETDAQIFIQDLIDSQIIVGELSPFVTGDDFLSRIIHLMKTFCPDTETASLINEINNLLNQLDLQHDNPFDLYKKIIENIDKIKIPYEENFLFQVDTIRNASTVTIGKEITDELQSTLLFLNKITTTKNNETLIKFKQAFIDRYEEAEIPLMEALDPEMGIGYPANNTHAGDLSPLLDNFFLPQQRPAEKTVSINTFQSILHSKLLESLSQNQKEIVFTDEDVKLFKENWTDLPPTLSCMFEMVKVSPQDVLIKLNSIGGSCGANLLARFAHTDERIAQLVKTIADKEQEWMPDVLLAEIAHLPDSRIGNILSRPHIRDYEILYLANSDLPHQQLIYMSDLTVSIRQGRICLRSKKLNKEIVPRLTTAHNYHNNPMPVYLFLCDLQVQNGRNGLYFNWGYLGEELKYLPRVRYKNTILSLATWKIKTEDMEHLFSIKEDDKLLAETEKWIDKQQLPKCVLMPDGDNELFVDWGDAMSIRALFSIIKKRQMVLFTEFVFDPENAVVKDEKGNVYLNECIVAFHKEQISK